MQDQIVRRENAGPENDRLNLLPRALRERKPTPTSKFQENTRGSHLDCRINPDRDADVCRICPKML